MYNEQEVAKAKELLNANYERGVGLSDGAVIGLMIDFSKSFETGGLTTTPNTIPTEETPEFKDLQEKHDVIVRERDHNWNELQKAQTEIKKLRGEITLQNTSAAASLETVAKLSDENLALKQQIDELTSPASKA